MNFGMSIKSRSNLFLLLFKVLLDAQRKILYFISFKFWQFFCHIRRLWPLLHCLFRVITHPYTLRMFNGYMNWEVILFSSTIFISKCVSDYNKPKLFTVIKTCGVLACEFLIAWIFTHLRVLTIDLSVRNVGADSIPIWSIGEGK